MTEKPHCVVYEGEGLRELGLEKETYPGESIVRQEQVLERILSMSEDSGREGCTYEDTNMDSVSVVFGYNLALNNIKDMIRRELKLE